MWSEEQFWPAVLACERAGGCYNLCAGLKSPKINGDAFIDGLAWGWEHRLGKSTQLSLKAMCYCF